MPSCHYLVPVLSRLQLSHEVPTISTDFDSSFGAQCLWELAEIW